MRGEFLNFSTGWRIDVVTISTSYFRHLGLFSFWVQFCFLLPIRHATNPINSMLLWITSPALRDGACINCIYSDARSQWSCGLSLLYKSKQAAFSSSIILIRLSCTNKTNEKNDLTNALVKNDGLYKNDGFYGSRRSLIVVVTTVYKQTKDHLGYNTIFLAMHISTRGHDNDDDTRRTTRAVHMFTQVCLWLCSWCRTMIRIMIIIFKNIQPCI